MILHICDSYEEMSEKLADAVIAAMSQRQHPLFCTASGDTPTGLYSQLVNRVQQSKLDISRWKFVGLDEWVGMDGQDEGSCRQYTDQHLFTPLQIVEDRICFFNGKADDLTAECRKVEQFIAEHGGIDAAILGVGMNGHVGLNEPGVSPDLHAHVMDVDPVTKDTGQKYFTEKKDLKRGITLGIASLMEVRVPFLVASGKHKEGIMQKVLEGPIGNAAPASLMRTHASLQVYIDKDASASLTSTNTSRGIQ